MSELIVIYEDGTWEAYECASRVDRKRKLRELSLNGSGKRIEYWKRTAQDGETLEESE